MLLIKGIPKILKHCPDYKFYFIGDGSMKEKCISKAKELGVYKNCVFTGNVSQNEVYRYLSISKLHVSASSDEAFGMVNLEAVALNTPILAHNVGGISEILKNTVNGFFYKLNDSQDLSEKIISILKNKELYESLQKGCNQIFSENFLLSEKNLKEKVNIILNK